MINNSDKIRVLYIAGWGRSGSTLLANILGQVEDYFSVGEIRYIWDRNVIENRLCGCGVDFNQCPVWNEIMVEAYGGMDKIDPHEMLRYRERGVRSRHIPIMLMPRGEQVLASRLQPYLDNLAKLYAAIYKVTNSRVIVDSSKFPSYAYILGLIPEIDLRVVHLIRDSRATAYSWRRKKLQPDTGGNMPEYDPIKGSLIWAIWNPTLEAFWRKKPEQYFRLRYEDFIRQPQDNVRKIVSLIDDMNPRLPFISPNEVEMHPTHTVSGNPNRFKTGTVTLKLDEEWRDNIKLLDKATSTFLSWPLLKRYGYL